MKHSVNRGKYQIRVLVFFFFFFFFFLLLLLLLLLLLVVIVAFVVINGSFLSVTNFFVTIAG